MLCVFIPDPLCQGQTIEVSDPSLKLEDNSLQITYNILNSDPSVVYNVSIRVTSENGEVIPANTLTGDIGDGVGGGRNKQIRWDLSADKIVMNSRIFVKVYVKASSRAITSPEMSSGGYNRTSLIAQSIPLPGLGLSRLTSKPHWIRGVLAYGCIGGSLALNSMARNTYDMIPENLERQDKNTLYQKSLSQDNFSEILAYTAIGIWITDLIWTVVGTSDLTKMPMSSSNHGFSLQSSMDPVTSIPLLGFRYNF